MKDNVIDTFTAMDHDTMLKSSCSYCWLSVPVHSLTRNTFNK